MVDRQLTHHPQEVDGGHSTRFGSAGTGGEGRVEAVDIERDVQLVSLAQRLGDCVGHDFLEAPIPNLLHGVPHHALFFHPGEYLGWRPITTQPNLYEAVARHRS